MSQQDWRRPPRACTAGNTDGVAMSLTNRPPGVFQKRDADDHELDGTSAVRRARTEFPLDETHGIALWPQHRLLADSRGLGWHDAYLSLATEAPWTKTLEPLPHYCLAYSANRPASVTRVIPGERRLERVELHPRLFGVVPADRPSSWKLVGSPDIELVYLRRGMVDRLAEEVFGVDGSQVELLPKLGFFDGMLEQLVLGLLDAALAEDGSADGIYADHLVRMITLHVLRCHSSRPLRERSRVASALRRDRVSRVRALIEESLDEDLSLERLAAEAGIGTHAFSAAFVRPSASRPTATSSSGASSGRSGSCASPSCRSRPSPCRPASPARATWPRCSSGWSG